MAQLLHMQQNMGWGASPADRKELLGACRTDGRNTHRFESENTVYVVDGNATFRSFGSAVKGAEKSAEMIARIAVRAIVKKTTKPDRQQPSIASFLKTPPAEKPAPRTAVIILFDHSARMMPQRADLHAERYRRPKPPAVVAASQAALEAAKSAELHDKQDFSALFQSASGKFRAYQFFARACEMALEQSEEVHAYAVGGPTGAVSSHSKRPDLTFPTHWTERTDPWGEADQKCYEASAAFAETGWKPIVVTIDTDMILQTIARYADAPPARIALKSESIDGSTLFSKFLASSDDSASVRLTVVALLAAAYGCDYCKPLSFAGFRKHSVARLALRARGRPVSELPVACIPDVELTEVATAEGTVQTFAWVTPTIAVDVRTNNAFLTAHKSKPGRHILIRANDRVLTRKVLGNDVEINRVRSGRKAFIISPKALGQFLGGAARVGRKQKATGLQATFSDIFTEFVRAAWSAIYFSGAGRFDINAAKPYAGPPPIPHPSPTAQLFGKQNGATFAAYVEPLSRKVI